MPGKIEGRKKEKEKKRVVIQAFWFKFTRWRLVQYRQSQSVVCAFCCSRFQQTPTNLQIYRATNSFRKMDRQGNMHIYADKQTGKRVKVGMNRSPH